MLNIQSSTMLSRQFNDREGEEIKVFFVDVTVLFCRFDLYEIGEMKCEVM